MTFISAFRCNGGIVIGADSQETYGDYKLTVDKLKPVQVGKYQIALGGAGVGDLVDSLCEHIQEWIGEWQTASEPEMIHLLRPKLREFYQVEVAAYPGDDATQKRIHALLCVKHSDNTNPFLFELRATTVRRAENCVLVGWDSSILQHFVRRLYKRGMPISQGVLLTLYLFSIVGSTATAVGGDTRVLIARDNGIHVHGEIYVAKIQENISLFTALIDKLVLSCPDTSLQEKQFETILNEFIETSRRIRKEYLHSIGVLSLVNALKNPNFTGDAYSMIPLGSMVTYSVNGAKDEFEVREQTVEESAHWKMMREMALDPEFDRDNKLLGLQEVRLMRCENSACPRRSFPYFFGKIAHVEGRSSIIEGKCPACKQEQKTMAPDVA